MVANKQKTVLGRIVNIVSTVLVIVLVFLALALVGVRLFGLTPYSVLSGSMEPEYPTKSLIYVKKVDPTELQVGDVITFMLSEETIVTHRIVEVVPDEEDPSVLRFRTKGDANDAVDGALVHMNNVLGSPIFKIEGVGGFVNSIQEPPGLYLAIAIGAMLLALIFLSDVFIKDDDKEVKPVKKQQQRKALPKPSASRGSHAAKGSHSKSAVANRKALREGTESGGDRTDIGF